MNPIKKLAILLSIAVLAGVCMPVAGHSTPPGNPVYTLYSPLNLTATGIECSAYLQWQKPQAPGGVTPAGIQGYYIYRDGTGIGYVSGADMLTYYDYDAEYGTYTYSVTANYDLTSYGSPGLFEQSPPSVPFTLVLTCDVPFPLMEYWDSGNFSMYHWRFIPSQSNWLVSTSQGNPAPTAIFTGTPSIQNYNITMKGMKTPGAPWVCAKMYLEFDYRLTDIASGGTEKLIAEYCIDTTWYPVVEIKNQGSTGWVHQKLDISPVCTHNFRVGFKVSGQSSANIGSWELDNIFVYAICKGPANPAYTRNGNLVHLTWEHPPCDSLQVVKGYNVYRTDEHGLPPFAKLNSPWVPGFTYTDTIPASITTGQFRYMITDVQKNWQDNTILCEAPGDTLVVDYALGVPPVAGQGIRIYPQPAKNNLVVSSSIPVESCEMFNVLGSKVFKATQDKKSLLVIPVTEFPDGIYLLQVKTGSGTIVKKVSVIH
ncbi:MAG: T9SS type A sorting domain-containing protein [Bacteroidota bacterium]